MAVTSAPRRAQAPISVVITVLCMILLQGCSSAYYSALESVGIPKRDIMVHRVEKARDSQEEAKEQFQTALEKFSALTGFSGDNLEATYHQLQSEYDSSSDKAEEVRQRIADIEDVSEALFEEWEEELDRYTSARLRRSSEQKLRATRTQYSRLISAMKRAEAKIGPVLATFNDQVMFLKHNLNARAIASLQSELESVETDIAALIRSMENSIAEANAFIQAMEQ